MPRSRRVLAVHRRPAPILEAKTSSLCGKQSKHHTNFETKKRAKNGEQIDYSRTVLMARRAAQVNVDVNCQPLSQLHISVSVRVKPGQLMSENSYFGNNRARDRLKEQGLCSA